MSDIKPALTPAEWADIPDSIEWQAAQLGDKARIIALANAALPDDDPRKITRDKIELVRSAAAIWEGECTVGPGGDIAEVNAIRTFCDALESFLPPDAS